MAESLNYTEEKRKLHLETLQSQTTLVMIPALTFLSLLLVTGVIGNSLVLLVYWRKRSKIPEKTFILVVAVYDLLTNSITIPGEMYESLNNWDFDHPTVCRIQQYISAAVVIGSGLMLVAISVTRYRKICRPFEWQISITQANVITAAIVVTSLLCAIPYGILNGRHTKSTALPGIHGYICEIDDAYVATIWPMVNSILFISIFVSASIPMLVLYALIGRLARRHGTAPRNTFILVNSHNDDVSSDVNTKSTDDCIAPPLKGVERVQTSKFVRWNETAYTLHTSFDEDKSIQQCQTTVRNVMTAPGKTLKPEGLSRTTSMLLAVSLVFVISFLSFLALECFKVAAPDVFSSLSNASLSLYHLFRRSFLINSAANPIIYSVCNIKFRKECLKLFSCS